MNLGKTLFEPGDEIKKILERQIGMQSAHNVKFGHGFAVAGSRGLEGFFQCHRVSPRRVLLAAESAQTAGGHADVGRIQVAIDVEIRSVAMQSLADVIRQPTHGQNIPGAVEREGVVDIQTLAGQNFVMNGTEPGVVSLKWMNREHQA